MPKKYGAVREKAIIPNKLGKNKIIGYNKTKNNILFMVILILKIVDVLQNLI